MRKLQNPLKSRHLYAAAIGALMAVGSVANAQTVDELTVIGRAGPDRDAPSLSQAVSYSDLDLTMPAQQDELKRRISDTANALCDRLGEGGTATFGPTCRQAAVRDSADQVRMAIDEAPARKAAMIARADAEARDRELQAMAATEAAAPASAVVPAPTVTVSTVTNGPVPDTPENRSRYGMPLSQTGKMTKPVGN